jgi:hypothetical protein
MPFPWHRTAQRRPRFVFRPILEPLEDRWLPSANVLTYHNDNSRDGDNSGESLLTPANVNANQFGQLFSDPVDGNVYAQPLYLANVTIPGRGVHNVVFVATEHDSVYAFDADSNTGANAAPLWHTSFLNPSAEVLAGPAIGNFPEVGITGTPVIDASTGTLYVVATTQENGVTVQRLHALDVATGQEKFGGSVVIAASVPGVGTGNDGRGHVPFEPAIQLQRSALLLLNAVVYIAWASFGDQGPFHGWVIGYDAKTLKQVAAFNTTPNGEEGGIWMSGGGLSADANGNIYLATGNGTFDPKTGGYGDSVLKLATTNGLTVADYFTPFNQNTLALTDTDLGSGGVLLLPDQPGPVPHELLVTGKAGTMYVLNRDNLGKYHADFDSVVQELPNPKLAGFNTPAVVNNSVYANFTNFTASNALSSFSLTNGRLSSAPITQTRTLYGYPGTTPSISANGVTNGIVWTLENAGSITILHAYDASNLSHELYNSNEAGLLDQPSGGPITFFVPTVANGKVYVAGQTGLSVYGLLPQPRSSTPEQLFVIGGDKQVYVQSLDPYGNPGGGYRLVTGGQVLSVLVEHDANNHPVLFVLGLDNQVYEERFDKNGNPIGSYFLAAFGQVQFMEPANDANNRPEVFALGLDNQVYALPLDSVGNPQGGYSLLAPGRVLSFDVVSASANAPELFALGLDNQVYALKLDANGSPVSGYFLSASGQVKSLVTGQDASGHPEVFVIGLDNQVYGQIFDTKSNPIGGYFLAAPGLVQSVHPGNDGDGKPVLFVVGLDNQVYAAHLNPGGGPNQGYILATPGRVQSVCVGHDPFGNPDLFVTEQDGQANAALFDNQANTFRGYSLLAKGRVLDMKPSPFRLTQ